MNARLPCGALLIGLLACAAHAGPVTTARAQAARPLIRTPTSPLRAASAVVARVALADMGVLRVREVSARPGAAWGNPDTHVDVTLDRPAHGEGAPADFYRGELIVLAAASRRNVRSPTNAFAYGSRAEAAKDEARIRWHAEVMESLGIGEADALIHEAVSRAEGLLREHRAAIARLQQSLMDGHVMTDAAVRGLMGR